MRCFFASNSISAIAYTYDLSSPVNSTSFSCIQIIDYDVKIKIFITINGKMGFHAA